MEEVKCCLQCGRDTTNKCGICRRCLSGHEPSGSRGRNLRPQHFTDSSIDPHFEEDEFHRNSSENYHGETPRDDL